MRLAEAAAAALSISDAGPGLCLALRPSDYSPAVPGGVEAGKSVQQPIGEGRQGGSSRAGGGGAAAGGGGEQAQPGRGRAPRSVTRSRRRPSLPGRVLRAAHSDTASAKHDGRRRRPRVRPAAAEASAHTARPAAAQRTQQAPPQAPPPAPRRPHPDSTRHSSSVGPGWLRP